MGFAEVNMIPDALVYKIDNSTGEIGKHDYSQCNIIAMGDGKNDYGIGNKYKKAEGDGFYKRSFGIFVKAHIIFIIADLFSFEN